MPENSEAKLRHSRKENMHWQISYNWFVFDLYIFPNVQELKKYCFWELSWGVSKRQDLFNQEMFAEISNMIIIEYWTF